MTIGAVEFSPIPRQVLLDANVWFSATKTDFFMEAHAQNALQLRWTTKIAKEWIKNVVSARMTSRAKAASRNAAMCNFVDDWQILHYGHLFRKFPAVHEKDRHVIAAAQRWADESGATVALVTENLKDFPKSAFIGTALERFSPNEYLARLCTEKPRTVARTGQICQLRHRNPPISRIDYVLRLQKAGLTSLSSFLAGIWSITI